MNNKLTHILIPLILSIIVSIISCSSHNIDTAGTASEVVTNASISGTLVNGGVLQKESMQVSLYQVGTGTSTALSKVSLADSLVGSLNTSSGSFKFDSLPAGSYRIAVTKDSVTLGGSDGITLSTGQALQITINITIIIQQKISINTINNVTVQNIYVTNGVAVKNADGTYTFKFPEDTTSIPVSVVVVDGDSTKTVTAQLEKQGDGSYLLVLPEGSGIEVSSSSSLFSASSSSNINISSSFSPPLSESSSSVLTSSSGACSNTYGTNTVIDCRDEKEYKTVVIGTQAWMAENLNYNSIGGSWCYNCGIYGNLYNWDSAKTACPSDWHLPSDSEWQSLEKYIGISDTEVGKTEFRGTNQGQQLKANSSLWLTGAGTDDFGFSALPAGFYSEVLRNISNEEIGNSTVFWTSTIDTNSYVWTRQLVNSSSMISRAETSKTERFSVRCIKSVL